MLHQHKVPGKCRNLGAKSGPCRSKINDKTIQQLAALLMVSMERH